MNWSQIIHPNTGEPTGDLVCAKLRCLVHYKPEELAELTDPWGALSRRCACCGDELGDAIHREKLKKEAA